jgi:hypothetical protein
MAGLLLPNNHTNVLIAAAIAHFNGGYFQQNLPPGWITVEAEGRLTIERHMIVQALGRACSDELWESLFGKPQGQVLVNDDQQAIVE